MYVDNDAQVLSHARNLLAASGGVLAVAGDLAYPAEIVYDWRVRAFLDFHQPVCLILAMTMHFFPPDQAPKITGRFIRALPAGSYVIMSVVGGHAQLGKDLARTYTAAPVYNHGPGGLARFMDGLELIEPGIVPARRWPSSRLGPRGPARPGVGRRGPQERRRGMSGPRWTLAAVTYHWADAYLITYTRDRWVALRRDTRKFLSGHTLDELEAAICADYGRQPVPREFDPPDSREEMSWPPIPFLPGPDDCDEDEEDAHGRWARMPEACPMRRV